jgi:hypothetical protein
MRIRKTGYILGLLSMLATLFTGVANALDCTCKNASGTEVKISMPNAPKDATCASMNNTSYSVSVGISRGVSVPSGIEGKLTSCVPTKK